jgi:hypothetical protein
MNFFYFLYFLFNSKYDLVFKSLKCLRGKYSGLTLLLDSICCSFIYGTSLDDFFSFRFYEKGKLERGEFATTSYMYNFHKSLNQREFVDRIDNKVEFRKYFRNFSGVSSVFMANDKDKLITWLDYNKVQNFVVKDPKGSIGTSIVFFRFNINDLSISNDDRKITINELFENYAKNDIIYIEPVIIQHHSIQSLAPSALNTIRIITVLRKDGDVDIISAVFRIAINSKTDNFSTGNLAAAVDVDTGVVISPGIKRLASCSSIYEYHPVTNMKILSFQIPFWKEVVKLVKEAAQVIPQVRTVGWDVAILHDRPIIIEGNPSWNKGAPQIPLDKGIRPLLDKYLGVNGI